MILFEFADTRNSILKRSKTFFRRGCAPEDPENRGLAETEQRILQRVEDVLFENTHSILYHIHLASNNYETVNQKPY